MTLEPVGVVALAAVPTAFAALIWCVEMRRERREAAATFLEPGEALRKVTVPAGVKVATPWEGMAPPSCIAGRFEAVARRRIYRDGVLLLTSYRSCGPYTTRRPALVGGRRLARRLNAGKTP